MLTGNHNHMKISVPGNQMYITFESNSTFAKKGFKAFIQKIGTKIIDYNGCKVV